MKGFCLEIQVANLPASCWIMEITLAALSNEDTENINEKLKIPTQTYEAKLKSLFPIFLKLFTFCLLV